MIKVPISLDLKLIARRVLRPNIVKVEGLRVRIPPIASEVIRKAIYEGRYESEELRLLQRWLEPEDRLMEVGAGLGLLSAYSARKIGSDQVHAFEANPALEAAIRQNYALNQVSPSLQMCLVGRQPGAKTFFVGENFWSSSIINKAKGARPIDVPVVSFNEQIRKIDPSFLILDIEGGEFELIDYADFHNVRKLLIEVHPWILSEEQVQHVQNQLGRAGFRRCDSIGRDLVYFAR